MTGLTSVTLRKLSPQAVADLAVQCGLDCVEWGGDVHVPPGDLTRACHVGKLTAQAGLHVCSYGSYYRLCQNMDFSPVLDSACALGAPNIRVWAGDKSPAEAGEDYYCRAAEELSAICALAAARKISVSTEYHRWTLSQTSAGVLRLLEMAKSPNLFTYWQPNPEYTGAENAEELRAVLPCLSGIHVFQWGADNTRHPLEAGREDWRQYLRVIRSAAQRPPMLLEFVQEDDPVRLIADAGVLRCWEETL